MAPAAKEGFRRTPAGNVGVRPGHEHRPGDFQNSKIDRLMLTYSLAPLPVGRRVGVIFPPLSLRTTGTQRQGEFSLPEPWRRTHQCRRRYLPPDDRRVTLVYTLTTMSMESTLQYRSLGLPVKLTLSMQSDGAVCARRGSTTALSRPAVPSKQGVPSLPSYLSLPVTRDAMQGGRMACSLRLTSRDPRASASVGN